MTMKKIAFISQFFGLGDIIFSMGIARHFRKKGYDIEWPVRGMFIEQLQRAYPKIKFINSDFIFPDIFEIKEIGVERANMLIVPIRWSNTIMKVPYKHVMRAKYDMYGLDWKIWKNAARWYRDFDKEQVLMEFLGIQPADEYNLINKRFGNSRELDINVSNGLKNIYMTDVIGFSMFDWAMVIENATTLHMVSTSTLYMVEVLNLKCKENHLYTRVPVEQNLEYVKPLLSKEYILHE